VFGGSLGALSINEAAVGAVERWRTRSDLAVHHVVGRRDWPTVARPLDTGDLVYEAVEYEDDMPYQLSRADLVVCRAGSGTCFELAATGRPSVIVPSLVTTGGQQLANAERMAAAGAAVVIRDDQLDADRLIQEVDALLADPARLDEMSRRVRALATPDAADRVVDLVEQHGRAR
jgi:UDP-N-acetylglucosamine--N-acetylmuramyl-(pentapeptide) pyrophosphoryl-undecaprenol N-acetylglucosamine transferase